MKTYRVLVTQRLTKEFFVEAENEEQAEDMVISENHEPSTIIDHEDEIDATEDV